METTTRYREWLAGVKSLLDHKEAKIKQVDIAHAVNSSPVHLNAIFRGRRKAGDALQDAISQALGKSYDELRELGRGGGLPALARQDNVEPANLPERWRRIPLISFVQAGAWTAAEALEAGEAEEWIEAPSRVGARAFALRVKGDSMEPVFREGEVVVVDPDIEAANGDYVVAALEREEATLKRYMREGGRDWLIPLNARYDPIEMTGRDWRVIGRVQMKLMEF